MNRVGSEPGQKQLDNVWLWMNPLKRGLEVWQNGIALVLKTSGTNVLWGFKSLRLRMRVFILVFILLTGFYNDVSNTVPGPKFNMTVDEITKDLPIVLGDSLRLHLSHYIFLQSGPIPPKIVTSIIGVESEGNINATGQVGEQGLMQIYPKYWRGVFPECGDNLYDPITNVCYGVSILKLHYSRTGDLEESIMLYNGSKTSTKYLNKVLTRIGTTYLAVE